jgi:hypothetical protein
MKQLSELIEPDRQVVGALADNSRANGGRGVGVGQGARNRGEISGRLLVKPIAQGLNRVEESDAIVG